MNQDAVRQLTIDLKEIFRRLEDLEMNPYSVTGGVVPAPANQGDTLLANAVPAWDILPTPGAAGYARVSTAVTEEWDQTPLWTGEHSFQDGIAFTGASDANELTIPDNTAIAFELEDAGGLEYLRIVSTNAQPVIEFNNAGADIDFHVLANGVPDALQVQGSDGQITLGALGAGFVQSDAGGVLSSAAIAVGDLPQHDIVGAQHSIAGAQWSVVGATALNTLGLFTPSANPGAAEALLKSGAVGQLQLERFGVGSAYDGLVTFSGVQNPLGDLNDPSDYQVNLRRNASTLNRGLGVSFCVSTTRTNITAAIIAENVGAEGQGSLYFYTKRSVVASADPELAMTLQNDGTAAFTAGIAMTGASDTNEFAVPDNTAIAFELEDAGGLEYLRLITTDAQPVVVWNEDGADVDFRVESDTHADAFQILGSTGEITLGVLGAGFVQSDANGVLSSAAIAAADLPAHTHSGAGQGGSLVIGTTDTDATLGSVLFAGIGGVIQQDNANLFWDNTNDALGIRSNAPHVNADALYVPWKPSDTQQTSYFGSANAANDQEAVIGQSYSNIGVYGKSITGPGVVGESSSDSAVKGLSTSDIGGEFQSATGTGLQVNLTGAGTAIANFQDNGTPVLTIQDGGQADFYQDLRHLGDPDTAMTFGLDQWILSCGGVAMIHAVEDVTDTITLGGDGVIVQDDYYIGLGAAAGRIEFDDQATDEINFLSCNVGIGTSTPDAPLEIENAGTALIHLDGGNAAIAIDRVAATARCETRYQTAAVNIWFTGLPDSDLAGDGTEYFIGTTSGGTSPALWIESDARVGINGVTNPAAQLHVDQASTTAAIPVLYLDQADVSEEMIEFNTTIGVGNAIEAVGAKTLTTTHFIKVTLPGGLTRYIPVGTIA